LGKASLWAENCPNFLAGQALKEGLRQKISLAVVILIMTTARPLAGKTEVFSGKLKSRRQAPTKSVILIMGRENYRTLCQRARPKLKRVI
jgi:hypothetical protein